MMSAAIEELDYIAMSDEANRKQQSEVLKNARRIRPLQGEVLVYMDSFQSVSEGGIVIPEKHQERSEFGEVRRLGIWKQNKRGALVPYSVKPGDRVMVRAACGRWLHSEKERLKIVSADDILAILEAGEKN